MAKIANPMSASTLLESVVSSIIFLLVFAMTMHFTSMVNSKKSDCYEQIVVQSAIQYAAIEFSSSDFQFGNYSKQYPWGEMNIEIESYKEFDSLKLITISTDFDDVKNRYVVER